MGKSCEKPGTFLSSLKKEGSTAPGRRQKAVMEKFATKSQGPVANMASSYWELLIDTKKVVTVVTKLLQQLLAFSDALSYLHFCKSLLR